MLKIKIKNIQDMLFTAETFLGSIQLEYLCLMEPDDNNHSHCGSAKFCSCVMLACV